LLGLVLSTIWVLLRPEEFVPWMRSSYRVMGFALYVEGGPVAALLHLPVLALFNLAPDLIVALLFGVGGKAHP
jgi:hypothetical protein